MLLTSKMIFFVSVLLAVAFFTLFERKLLGYAQTRHGPDKVSITGTLQPLGDAAKLLTKATLLPSRAHLLFFYGAPLLALSLALIGFFALMDAVAHKTVLLAILLLIFILSLGVFPVTVAGWASNSEFGTLGGIRALAQTLSYEVILFLVLITPFYAAQTLSLTKNTPLLWSVAAPLSLFLFTFVLLGETNRAPFDLAEGESELVSGFNIEYGGAGFTVIFLAEYAQIMFMVACGSLLLAPSAPALLLGLTLVLSVRAAYPRARYDLLMETSWAQLLPAATVLYLLFFLV